MTGTPGPDGIDEEEVMLPILPVTVPVTIAAVGKCVEESAWKVNSVGTVSELWDRTM